MPIHLKVYTSDGQRLDIADFEGQSALDLRGELDSSPYLTFEMDGATVLVARDHIVRIDIEEGPAP